MRSRAGRSGSRTPKTMTATEMKAGITAIQNTWRKLSASSAMNTMAASGPTTAPMVSSDCRRPKALPRAPGGVRSAISASRGAPRMPLPTRSTKRAAVIVTMPVASGNTGLVTAARP